MKLELIAVSGRWRTVVEFDRQRWPEVHDAAASLARALGPGFRWRTVDDDGSERYLEGGMFRQVDHREGRS